MTGPSPSPAIRGTSEAPGSHDVIIVGLGGMGSSAAAELAAMLGLPLSPPSQILLIGNLRLGLLGLELLTAATQPGKPRAAIDQLGRKLVTPRTAIELVLAGVDLRRLAKHPLDLLADRLMRTGRLPRSVSTDRSAIQRDNPDRH